MWAVCVCVCVRASRCGQGAMAQGIRRHLHGCFSACFYVCVLVSADSPLSCPYVCAPCTSASCRSACPTSHPPLWATSFTLCPGSGTHWTAGSCSMPSSECGLVCMCVRACVCVCARFVGKHNGGLRFTHTYTPKHVEVSHQLCFFVFYTTLVNAHTKHPPWGAPCLPCPSLPLRLCLLRFAIASESTRQRLASYDYGPSAVTPHYRCVV